MLEQLSERVQKAINEEVFPGCVIGVVRNGEREVFPFGALRYDEGIPNVRENTIYDLASVTKSIPVASLAAMFVEQGKLKLDEKVTHYLPTLQNSYDASIVDLLEYRVRGSRMSRLRFSTFEQLRTHIFEEGFDGPPGKSEYTNLPAFILGFVLESAGGEILPALAEKYLFGPLEMHDTTFFPSDTKRIAPTEIVDGDEVRGIVHDESARIFAQKRRAVGHAGLFSTVPDLLKFVEALLQGKFPEIMNAAEQGLGWHLSQPWFMGDCGPKTFGKTGFTGTSVVIDREKNAGLLILSNRTYPERPPDAGSIQSGINAVRADIANIVFRMK